jgi:hypothetical protein
MKSLWIKCMGVCFVLPWIPLQVSSSLGRVSSSLIAISPSILLPARQVLGEMPKPLKFAQIGPRFFQHLHATSSNTFSKFHAYLISQTPNTPLFSIYSVRSSAECLKFVFFANLQTKHPLHSYSLIYTYSWSISSIPSHFMPHFQFQTSYGIIYRSNVVLASFDPWFSKSLNFHVLNLCVCIYSHFIYLWLCD